MKSMTGFGSARGHTRTWDLCLEISSVNSRRGLDISINLPRELADMEASLRAETTALIGRGKLSVSLRAQANKSSHAAHLIQREVVEHYHREASALAKKLKLPPPNLDTLLRLPGSVGQNTSQTWEDSDRDYINKLFTRALENFQKSREREGASLAKDLQSRFRAMIKSVALIQKRAPHVVREAEAKLKQRLAAAGIDTAMDADRLHREIVILTDRADISEELTRLDAHLQEALRLLSTGDAVGRNLDFQIQEISREINTTGNKANDITISKIVVGLKTELEKIREQVQNLE